MTGLALRVYSPVIQSGIQGKGPRRAWLRVGLMYLRLPLDNSTAAYNRAASLWVAMFAFTLMPSETACTVWNQERAVVRAPCSPARALPALRRWPLHVSLLTAVRSAWCRGIIH